MIWMHYEPQGKEQTVWTPPPRSVITGHRVPSAAHIRPVPTWRLNWRWWLAEWPMRSLAKSMRRAVTTEQLCGQEIVREGEE